MDGIDITTAVEGLTDALGLMMTLGAGALLIVFGGW